jgi:hypothetical protein
VKLVNLQSGALEDIPEEQVPQAYAARTHGFESPDAKVPIKLADGRVGTVPASQAHVAFGQGATVASHQELAEAKYGGVGGMAVTGAEGLARGATVGLFDPAAVGAARLVGGEKAAEATRESLEGHKEANPWTAGITEVGGAAIPALATGGATAPEEAAALGAGEAASGASRVAKLARVLGAPARAVGKAGEVAGGLAESVVGRPGAGGALARIAKQAVKAGATGAAEGSLFGAGQEVSEDTLGDHELTAQRLAAAVGHGALMGGMFGTALGAGTGALREGAGGILNRIAPTMEKQADVEAYKAIHPKLGVTKEVLARAGGEEAVGGVARKYGLFGTSVVDAASSDPEAILARTTAAKEQVGQSIDKALAASGEKGASIKASEAIAHLNETIEKLESTAAGSQKSAPLRAYRDQLAEKLGMTTEAVPKTSEEVKAWIKANPEAIAAAGNGGLPKEAFQKLVTKDSDVPLAQLTAERRALQANVYQYQKSLTAPLHIEELRKFSGHLNDLEEQAMNKASEAVGGQEGTQLRALNKDYQRLSLIERATKERVATQATNQRLSLTDKMFGAAHVAGALASGHPATAIAAAGTALGSKFVRERGNAMASVALGRLAKIDLLARASEQVDNRLGSAFRKFADEAADRTGPRIRLRHFGSTAASGDTPEDRYAKVQREVPAHPAPDIRLAHVDQAIPELSTHAPKTALALGATVANGAAYLAAQQPKAPGVPSLLGKPPRPSQAAMSAYVRQSQAVDDPIGTIERGLETGKIHSDEIQAIATSKPKMYAQDIQRPAIELAAQKADKLGYSKIVTLSKIAQVPLHPSLTLPGQAFLQSTFAPSPTNPNPMAGPVRGAPKRQLKGIAEMTSLGEPTP